MYGVEKVDKDSIKTGMIKVKNRLKQYSYRENIPVQIMMSFGNEFVFNEKQLSFGYDQKITYSLSKMFYPADYEDQKTYVLKMKDEFSDYFDEIWKIYNEGGEVEEINPYRRAD